LGSTARVGRAVQREPAAGERLEVMGSRATGDQHQVLAAGGTNEQLHRTLRFSGLEKCTGEIHGCLGRVEALVEICVEVEGFLRRGERELHVPDVQRCGGAAKEGPDQGVRVAQQTRRLDATVEQLPGGGELAAQGPLTARPSTYATARARAWRVRPQSAVPLRAVSRQ